MTRYVTSADGTRIAFDRVGNGPTLVIVAGLFCDRQRFRSLAEQLAEQFTVINYDRRGRGDSGNTLPYAVEREIEDLGALIAATGGSVAVYGHSSGAGLALEAAGSGLPISRLVLHEPPYSSDDEESRIHARELAQNVQAAITQDRRADAIKLFLTAMGMPAATRDQVSRDPKMLAMAPTMPYEFEVMGDFDGGMIPTELVRRISIPTLVIAGSASPEFFREVAKRITELLPNGRQVVLDGQDHGAPAEVVAPVVGEFLSAPLVQAV